MNKEQEKEEKEIIEMEKVIVKQIKNTFEDVKRIEFIAEMSGVHNEKAGFWSFVVNITTPNGVRDTGNIIYKADENKITSYGPISKDFDDIITPGKTIDLVEVIFSDGSKGGL
ncbi:hypothetical protein [Enterococcus rivorum]|nr:hypothetical protein [Enterococcus rivorum]MBP2097682.1 hypothetical protein [Enterococcus rivorum]